MKTIKMLNTNIVAKETKITPAQCKRMGYKDKYIGTGTIAGTDIQVKVYESDFNFIYRNI